MNSAFYEKSLETLVFQRNVFLSLVAILSLSLFTSITFLFWKSDKVIVIPPSVEKEFWVDSNTVSATYLEQFGYFLGELLLGKSAQSAPSQKQILLRHTDPSYSGILSRKLLEEEQMLSRQNASYVFFPVDIRVNPQTLEVHLIGDRTFYISGSPVSTEREGYVLRFSGKGGRLLLSEVSSLSKEEMQ